MGDLISRSALLEKLGQRARKHEYDECTELTIYEDMHEVKNAPAVDAVSREVVEQIMWERDTAMEQLKEHGIPFGGIAPDVVEVVRCEDCKHYGWGQEPCHGRVKHFCKLHRGLVVISKETFCSYGERRADDAD